MDNWASEGDEQMNLRFVRNARRNKSTYRAEDDRVHFAADTQRR